MDIVSQAYVGSLQNRVKLQNEYETFIIVADVQAMTDITFCKAHLVPLGEDQLPHMEVARKLVRRFNSLYKPVLIEPEVLLSDCPRLVGTDGNAKMGKSLNNSIYLSDTEEEVITKVKSVVTDANRITMKDKGNPDICIAYKYHTAFNKEECDNIEEICRNSRMILKYSHFPITSLS